MMKVCAECHIEKKTDCFRRASKFCEPCADKNREYFLAKNRLYYENNTEKAKAYSAERRRTDPEGVKEATAHWRSENKGRFEEMQRVWREKNVDRLRAYRAATYEKNKGKENAQATLYKAENKERLARYQADRLKQFPELNRFARSLRRAAEKAAMPKWADRKKMREIYAECVRVSEATGIPHHVDHIYPLKSDWVCGLHCEANLQILPAAVNQAKSNRPWPMTG